MPYSIEPMNCCADARVKRVTLMWAAQTGKTEACCNNVIGYYISQDPKSIITMHPSQTDLNTWIEAKLDPLITDTPIVTEKVSKPRAREGVNNKHMKSFTGGFLMFSWAGAPNTQRSKSAPIILCDEIDGYPKSKEGSQIELLRKRSATFGDQAKLICSSTPTIRGFSEIEKAFEAGDKRRYHLPCPHCEELQTLKFHNLVWPKEEEGKIHRTDKAYYVCEHCGGEITDADKLSMLPKGKWIAEKKFMGHASFHINELYSPFRTFSDVAESFIEMKKEGNLQVFINVSLAETYEEESEGVDDKSLYSRRESYKSEVPMDAFVLVCGVDVQDDRLECEVVAFAEGKESWNIDYRIFIGDTEQPDVWEELDQLLDHEYLHESGSKLKIMATCVDSGGHRTQIVYSYCKARKFKRVFAIKGVGGEGRALVTRPLPKKGGKKNKRPVELYLVAVDEAKNIHYSRLRIKFGDPGYCHFPTERDSEYFKQLTGEKLITRRSSGKTKREWVKSHVRVEALDCRIYAIAALEILNPIWEKIPRFVKKESAQIKAPVAPKAPQRRRQISTGITL